MWGEAVFIVQFVYPFLDGNSLVLNLQQDTTSRNLKHAILLFEKSGWLLDEYRPSPSM